MPEREFELYLSLLSRFLRLRPAQRDEIADELRDHLDERLEELAARGLSREDAILKALEEFGDAAELAKHFTQAAHIRRRRLIMRCTYGTVAALAASLLVATAFWPTSSQGPSPSHGVAQDAKRAPVAADPAPAPSPDSERAEIEAKLSKRLDTLNWGGITLAEALDRLSDEIGVDIVIDHATLVDEGIAEETPIRKMSVKHTRLEARAALELILEAHQLGYFIRDGLLVVTTQTKLADTIEVQIYNIRDLPATVTPATPRNAAQMPRNAVSAVSQSPARGLAAIDPGQTGGTAVDPKRPADDTVLLEIKVSQPATVKLPQDSAAVQVLRQGFGGAGGGTGGGAGGAIGGGGGTMRSNLAEVIMACVAPESWNDVGGPGAISECTQYDGLLFVRADPVVHAKIKRFLSDLRGVLREAKPAAAAGAGAARRPEKGSEH